MSYDMKATYIEVVRGDYYQARGYIIADGNTPNLANCVLYYENKEIRKKLKLDEIKIIEPCIPGGVG